MSAPSSIAFPILTLSGKLRLIPEVPTTISGASTGPGFIVRVCDLRIAVAKMEGLADLGLSKGHLERRFQFSIANGGECEPTVLQNSIELAMKAPDAVVATCDILKQLDYVPESQVLLLFLAPTARDLIEEVEAFQESLRGVTLYPGLSAGDADIRRFARRIVRSEASAIACLTLYDFDSRIIAPLLHAFESSFIERRLLPALKLEADLYMIDNPDGPQHFIVEGDRFSFSSAMLLDAVDRDGMFCGADARGPHMMQLASDPLRADKSFVLKNVSFCGDKLNLRWNQKPFPCCGNPAVALQLASELLRDDLEVVQIAVKLHGPALEFASPRLRDDPQVVLMACESSYGSHCAPVGLPRNSPIQFASDRLLDDRDFGLQIVALEANHFQFLSAQQRDDAELLRVAIVNDAKPTSSRIFGRPKTISNADAYVAASDRLKDDRVFALDIVNLYPRCFRHLSPRLRDDEEVLRSALESKCDKKVFCREALSFASARLQDKEDFALLSIESGVGRFVNPRWEFHGHMSGAGYKGWSERLRDDAELVKRALQWEKREASVWEAAQKRNGLFWQYLKEAGISERVISILMEDLEHSSTAKLEEAAELARSGV